MDDKEAVERIAAIAGVTVQTLRKKLVRRGLDALLNEAERLSFAERFGSNTTLTPHRWRRVLLPRHTKNFNKIRALKQRILAIPSEEIKNEHSIITHRFRVRD